MTRKPCAFNKLPLLGSNQDSPDPESDRAPGYTLSATTGRVVFRRILSFGHTKSPTTAHTVGKSLVIDRIIPRVGRVKKAIGSDDPTLRSAINRTIDALIAAGRRGVLRSLRDGSLSPMEMHRLYGADAAASGSAKRDRWVYFIRRPDTGAIKIGVASDTQKRIRSIQSHNDVPLELLLVIPGDNGTEAVLHRAFAPFRKAGEWFHPAPELLTWIADRSAAGEPIALPRPLRASGRRGWVALEAGV